MRRVTCSRAEASEAAKLPSVAQTEQQRRAMARDDDAVGLASAHHRDGIGADQLAAARAHRVEEIGA